MFFPDGILSDSDSEFDFSDEDFCDDRGADYEGILSPTDELLLDEENEKYLKYFWRKTYAKPFKSSLKVSGSKEILLFDDLRLALKRDNPSIVKKFFKLGNTNSKSEIDESGMKVLDFAVAYAACHSLRFILASHSFHDLNAEEIEIGSFLQVENKQKVAECIKILQEFGIKYKQGSTAKLSDVEIEQNEMEEETGDEKYLNFKTDCVNVTRVLLLNLALNSVVPLLESIPFHSFLKLTENDLNELGVFQLGYQKVILDAIEKFHLQPWNESCISLKRTSRPMRGVDLIMFFMNMKFQLDTMNSSIRYAKQLEDDNKCEDADTMKEIEMNFLQVRKNMTVLRDEVLSFRKTLHKVCDGRNMDPPHYIVYKQKNKCKKWMKWLVVASVPLITLYAVARLKFLIK